MAAIISDAELVARCRAGDEAAWRELVDRFARYVYAISVRVYRLSEHDADDVFQDVFARTYEHLDRLRDDDAIRPWLAQLTRRLCVDRLRAGARVEVSGEPIEPGEVPDAFAAVDEALTVHDAMRVLPEHCQTVLDRFFARDESYRTIGDELELPAGTIASRISRCLEKLRSELEGRSDGADTSGEG